MKLLKKSKKVVFETLKDIIRSYEANKVYLLQDKEKAISNTLIKYYDYYEWLQDLNNKPIKIKPKKVYNCEICNSLIEKGFCSNKECIAYSPVS